MTTREQQSLWEREQRRRGTLVQLGIEPLVSRFNPEGARPHRHLQPLHPPAGRQEPERAGPVSGKIPAIAPADCDSGVPGGFGKSGGAVTPAAAKVAADSTDDTASVSGAVAGAGQAGTGAPVAFQLMIVSAGAWLWLELLEDALIRREQLQLVQGMARAVTEGDLAMSHLQFGWPLAEHSHLPRHADAARDSVSGQLRRLARERQARGYIFMGAACREWVHVPPALACLDIPSTLAMLAEPALKRDAWQVLQPHSS